MMEMRNLYYGDVISAFISKDSFMKAPDEYGISKDFPEKFTEWIATTGGKRCADEDYYRSPFDCYHYF